MSTNSRARSVFASSRSLQKSFSSQRHNTFSFTKRVHFSLFHTYARHATHTAHIHTHTHTTHTYTHTLTQQTTNNKQQTTKQQNNKTTNNKPGHISQWQRVHPLLHSGGVIETDHLTVRRRSRPETAWTVCCFIRKRKREEHRGKRREEEKRREEKKRKGGRERMCMCVVMLLWKTHGGQYSFVRKIHSLDIFLVLFLVHLLV